MVEVFGDSRVVIRQLAEDYDCVSDNLLPYFVNCREMMAKFRQVTLTWIPRDQNDEANRLVQVTFGYVQQTEDIPIEILQLDTVNWRADLLQYLKDLARGANRKTRRRALRHVLIGDELHFRTMDGVLLKCLGPSNILSIMHDVHEGTCGTHQSAHKMKWLIRRSGFYWPSMLEDCFKYYRGCQDCQRFSAVQMAPADLLHPIVKPWPFRGWGMDMIGQINPPTSKGHKWILAATDYFTKWVEAVPLKNVTARDVVNFVREHIVYRFGIPQTITTDQGTIFTAEEFKQFAREMGITLIQSSPYYAQANGQAEASNKSLIKLIKRKIDKYPK